MLLLMQLRLATKHFVKLEPIATIGGLIIINSFYFALTVLMPEPLQLPELVASFTR